MASPAAGSMRSVAPSCSAVLRFISTGSMAKMRDAPAMRAPWMTAWPTPPQPMTATVEPGSTLAVLRAAPTPVVTPQPMRASCSAGQVGLDLHDHRPGGDHLVGERAETGHAEDVRAVGADAAGGEHELVGLLAQVRRIVQAVPAQTTCRNERSDDLVADLEIAVTSEPTSRIVPAPSWPRMTGGGMGTPPVATVRSLWHTPLASMWTRTSLGPTSGELSSSMTSGSLYWVRIAARIAGSRSLMGC